MACKCCNRFAPRHADGSELPLCEGTAAIKEARNLAKLWRRRALERGYGTANTCGCGTRIRDNRAECDSCFESHEHTCFCASCEVRRMDKDWLRLYGCLPSADNPHKLNRCACEESDLECKRHPELAESERKRKEAQSRDLGQATAGTSSPRPAEIAAELAASCVTGGDREEALRDGKFSRTPELGRVKHASDRTMDEKMADHLAQAIAAGRAIAYCQGPRRHHCIVGGPMHDQLLERGCFHCGAFPE